MSLVASSDFLSFLSKHKDSKLAIGMHRNADLDALCSAYALSTIFTNSTLVTPDEMNVPAKNLAKDFGISVKEFKQVRKEEFDGMIVVDSGSFVMIDDARKWKILCLIDHHQKAPENERIGAEVEIWDGNSPSTSQIIASILPEISKKAAFALSIGIVSDTARFKSGNVQSFEQLAKLMKICGKSYAEILNYAEPEREADEKVGILSALAKANVITYRNFVIATTIVPKNESDASSALTEYADVAFSASWRNDVKETRVSSRARKSVTFALNELMRKVGEHFSATGGGHAKAAGANAKARPEEVLEFCVEAAKDAIDSSVS